MQCEYDRLFYVKYQLQKEYEAYNDKHFYDC